MNMIIELAVSRVKEIFDKKGYKFFENGNYNLNIIGVRTENTIPMVSASVDNENSQNRVSNFPRFWSWQIRYRSALKRSS